MLSFTASTLLHLLILVIFLFSQTNSSIKPPLNKRGKHKLSRSHSSLSSVYLGVKQQNVSPSRSTTAISSSLGLTGGPPKSYPVSGTLRSTQSIAPPTPGPSYTEQPTVSHKDLSYTKEPAVLHNDVSYTKEPAVLHNDLSYTKQSTVSSNDLPYTKEPHQDLSYTKKPAAPSPNNNTNIQRWLDAHNAERARYGSPKLTWNSDLVAAAHQRAATCVFQHSPHNPHGENIAAGQGSPEEVCNDWANGINEKGAYNPKGGSGTSTHWTQMVWKDTKEIGCCSHTCESMAGTSLGSGPIHFWVCEYDPPGNVLGEAPSEVHAGLGGSPLPSTDTNSYTSEPGYIKENTKVSLKSHFRRAHPGLLPVGVN